MKCKETNVKIDLSLDNYFPVIKSNYLRKICEKDQYFLYLTRYVQHWAQSKKINDANFSTFNSYSLLLLSLFYFQKTRNLESVKSFLGKESNMISICDLEKQIQPIFFRSEKARLEENILQETISGFFHFYSNFDFASSVISPFDSAIYPKSEWELSNEKLFIAIEDPFESSNVARAITHETFNKIKREIEKESLRLKN